MISVSFAGVKAKSFQGARDGILSDICWREFQYFADELLYNVSPGLGILKEAYQNGKEVSVFYFVNI